MVSRRTNFGERSQPAPGRGGKLQSAGGGGVTQSNVSPLLLKGFAAPCWPLSPFLRRAQKLHKIAGKSDQILAKSPKSG